MPLKSYAQKQEDLVLYRALRDVRRGCYIDVGAQHPFEHSVTKLFYECGWSGINIEPVQRWFDMIATDRPRDINLQVAAAASAGETILHEVLNTGLSTVVDRYAARHIQAGFKCRSYAVPTRRLDDICAEYAPGEIHFLKIDAEGAEREILEGCDFARYRPWIVVMEATEPLTDRPSYRESETILTAAGYEFAESDTLNRYYVACEHRSLKRAIRTAVKESCGPLLIAATRSPIGYALWRLWRFARFHLRRFFKRRL